MIVLTSYKEIKKSGLPVRVYSISNSHPDDVEVQGQIKLLVPPWPLVKRYKAGEISEEEFTDLYREVLKNRWQYIKKWLQSLDNQQTLILCCWEGENHFCHRQLVAKMISKHRPDIEVLVK